LIHRWGSPLLALHLPRGVGAFLAASIVLGAGAYGAVKGEHVPELLAQLQDWRDAAGNAVGFRIAAVALTGQKQLTREEILASAGITGRSSLLFLDVAAARARLKANPWIADATVRKFYPDRLQISVTERQAFALWQKDGQVSVISADGTVLERFVPRRFVTLPLVVGNGAETRAKEFLALVGRFPEISDALSAGVLVAERRWNLHLKNGIDVRLPEDAPEQALATLVRLDNEKHLLSRDITAVDLRLRDRVTVRLSDDAAQAREAAIKEKEKKVKRKGGEA